MGGSAEAGPTGGGILRSHRAFRRLWAARAVSTVGDSLGLVALLLHLAQSTGQAFAVAALLLVGDVAPALLAPFTGGISDRLGRRRVMIGCELVQGTAVAAIAVSLPPLPLLLVLVAVRAVAAQVFQPAARAAVPALVADRHLEQANAALGFGSHGTDALGPLIAAGLLPLLGVRGVLLVDVATFAVAALLLGSLPTLRPAGAAGATTPFLADARAGLRHFLTVPAVRVVALGFTAVVAFNGVDDVALVFLARDTLHADGSAVALLYGAVGIGLVLGYAVLARRAARWAPGAVLLAGFAVSSMGNLLTGLAWAVAAAFAVQAVRGIGLSAIDVGVNTFLQRRVPAELLGRVFGNLYGAVGAAAAVSYLFGAALIDLTGPRATFLLAGGGGLLVTAATLAATTDARRRGAPGDPPPTGPR